MVGSVREGCSYYLWSAYVQVLTADVFECTSSFKKGSDLEEVLTVGGAGGALQKNWSFCKMMKTQAFSALWGYSDALAICAKEMALSLRTFAGLAEEESLVPALTWWLTAVCISYSRESEALYWLLQAPGACVVRIYTSCRQILRHIKQVNIFLNYCLCVWEFSPQAYLVLAEPKRRHKSPRTSVIDSCE